MVLPADVTLVPVDDLPEGMLARVGAEPGDVTVSRVRSRTRSKIVDADTASLLETFREPKTIVEAVIDFSAGRGGDAEETLEELLPVIRNLVRSRLLVPEESDDATPVAASLASGGRVAGFRVVRTVQVFEDTEIYQAIARDDEFVALKVGRPGRAGEAARKIAREAGILRHLDGHCGPGLVADGEYDGRPYIATGWCRGVAVSAAAAEHRRAGDDDRLFELAALVLEAYACLHDRGVVHGDVHPHNVLVDAGGAVTILDFGLSSLVGSGIDVGRGGIGFFLEPEYAAALLEGRRPPQPTYAGEQYALAALLYYLVTGVHYRDFRLERKEMLRQIAGEPPAGFARHGIVEWTAVEHVLFRGLAKSSNDRFPSVRDFAAALRGARREASVRAPGRPRESDLVEAFVACARIGGRWLKESARPAPVSSVSYGAAGVALALYRLATVRRDAHLLSTADVWATRAAATSGSPDAFAADDLGIGPDTVGPISVWHTAAGVHLVRTLVAAAMGDAASTDAASADFVASSSAACQDLDLTLGRSGTVLGCALLLEAVPADPELRALGDRVTDAVWAELEGLHPVSECDELPLTGMAHGWAGVLYATMRWCLATGRTIPPGLPVRLAEMEELAAPLGRGIGWPRRVRRGARLDSTDFMPGWCNGSAGVVHLWTTAHEVFGDDRFLELAEGAAWDAWEAPDPLPQLCCGLAGRSYALLDVYRHTGEERWLARAKELAGRAATGTAFEGPRAHSLYKGEAGIAVLMADLADPQAAAMPLFASER